MAHSANIISQIKLPNNTTYDIHDVDALHYGDLASELDKLGLGSVLVFKGIVESESKLPTASAEVVGHVYLLGSTEYVCVQEGTTYKWEKLGNVHDAASSTHTHTVKSITGTNQSSAVTGTATGTVNVTPTKAAVSGAGTASAQVITKDTDNVLGEGTVFTTAISGKGLGTVTKKVLAQQPLSRLMQQLAQMAPPPQSLVSALIPLRTS